MYFPAATQYCIILPIHLQLSQKVKGQRPRRTRALPLVLRLKSLFAPAIAPQKYQVCNAMYAINHCAGMPRRVCSQSLHGLLLSLSAMSMPSVISRHKALLMRGRYEHCRW